MRAGKKEIIARQSELESLRFIKRSMQRIFSLTRINSRGISGILSILVIGMICVRDFMGITKLAYYENPLVSRRFLNTNLSNFHIIINILREEVIYII